LQGTSGPWILDDDDAGLPSSRALMTIVLAAAMLERFTALMSSSNENVQLASCRALSGIMRMGDVSA